VGRLTRSPVKNIEQAAEYKLVTVVRDPIDHFFSGFSECGERMWKKEKSQNPSLEKVFDETKYDERIQNWLALVEEVALNRTTCNTKMGIERFLCPCAQHSFPQANWLFTYTKKRDVYEGEVYPNLEVIGDLGELLGILKLANLTVSHKWETGRNHTSYDSAVYYPRRKDLLTVHTWRLLCRFTALDYFLFDFELPQACTEADLFLSHDHSPNAS